MQLHQMKRSKASLSDEYETPKKVYDYLCNRFDFYPELDVSAKLTTAKCKSYFNMAQNALRLDWCIADGYKIDNVWCNPPHSLTLQFVRKAHDEWNKFNINIMMILPTNTMSSGYWHGMIEGRADYYAIPGRIQFLVDGKPSKYKSRNAYVCVIWRKRKDD